MDERNDHMYNHDSGERRLPLSDADIVKIALAISEHTQHAANCRFKDVNTHDLEETVNFVKNFNKAMDEGKSAVRKSLLVALVWMVIGLVGVGAGRGLIEYLRRFWSTP